MDFKGLNCSTEVRRLSCPTHWYNSVDRKSLYYHSGFCDRQTTALKETECGRNFMGMNRQRRTNSLARTEQTNRDTMSTHWLTLWNDYNWQTRHSTSPGLKSAALTCAMPRSHSWYGNGNRSPSPPSLLPLLSHSLLNSIASSAFPFLSRHLTSPSLPSFSIHYSSLKSKPR